MKTLSFILYCAVAFLNQKSYCQIPVEDSLRYSRQILRIEQELLDAIPMADTNTWKKYLDKNYRIITEDGTGFDLNSFMATFSVLPKGVSGYIRIIKPHLIFKGNIAILQYLADEYEWVFGQKIHTSYSTMSTYFQSDTSWKILGSQVFEVPQLPPPISVPPEILKSYEGVYRLNDTVQCNITMEAGKLYIQKKGRKKEDLFAETYNIFFRESDTRGRKIFSKDESGKMLMRERRNGQDIVWKRL